MRSYAKIALLVLLSFAAGQGVARTINVSSASAINKTWSAGDTLLFTNGIYSNFNLTLKGTGSAASPIVLRAVTPGSVFLKGSSLISIEGSYIEVNGIRFTGTYTGKNHIIQFSSSSAHCRLTECAIESYNVTDATKDYKWVSIKGKENRVDHCYFVNKTNMGTLLVVWLEENIVPKHQIDHNYFGYRDPVLGDDGKPLNGQEIIRIGDSSTSMQDAQCVVERNYFENCDGETEMISNKSCGNIYRYNTFYACAGTLTLRHGNACTAESNWFFGTGKDATGGIRVIGEDHTVTHNYFQDLIGNNYRAAICVVRGKPNSALHEYFQVKNAYIAHNAFVNCKEAVCINYNSSSDCNLPALNTTIENNIVFNDNAHKSDRVVTIAASGGSVTWSANIYNNGKFSSFSPSSSEWNKNTEMVCPEPATDIPSADNSGPAWRHSDTPADLMNSQLAAKGYRKIIQHGHVVIITPDGRQIYIL